MFLARAQLGVHLDAQALFCCAAFQTVGHQHRLGHGLFLSRERALHFFWNMSSRLEKGSVMGNIYGADYRAVLSVVSEKSWLSDVFYQKMYVHYISIFS